MTSVQTVSIFTSVPTIIRTLIFSSWIAGYSDKQTLTNLVIGLNEEEIEIQLSIIQNQYQIFEALESYLRRPKYFLKEQTNFPMNSHIKLFLIERYYSIDAAVIRELIGKKIIGKTRRDLDHISSRTFIPLVSCRRQFDNLRAVMHRAEESPNDLYVLVNKKFLLPEPLCRSYVAVIFLNYHQIRINNHGILRDTPLDIILDCAHILIGSWTVNGNSLPFNPRMPHIIRDLQSFWNSTSPPVFNPILMKLNINDLELSQKLHPIILRALQIGSSLLQTHRVQDLLIDIINEVSLPLKNVLGLSSSGFCLFFSEIIELLQISLPNFFKVDSDIKSLVERFFTGLSRCSAAIFSDFEPRKQTLEDSVK